MHLAARKDLIYPRVATLKAFGKGWVDFARAIHANYPVGRGLAKLSSPPTLIFVLIAKLRRIDTISRWRF